MYGFYPTSSCESDLIRSSDTSSSDASSDTVSYSPGILNCTSGLLTVLLNVYSARYGTMYSALASQLTTSLSRWN
jgi:hypothetical protein